MKYNAVRTDTADAGLRKIVLYIAQNFGNDVALKKLDEIEDRIRQLGENPDLGIDPRYLVLKRQGYKVLILEKDLVFYKVNEARKEVIICCRRPETGLFEHYPRAVRQTPKYN